MKTEIEIKILLTPTIFKTISSYLKRNYKKDKQTHHIEYYLNNPAKNFFFKAKEGYKDAYDYLRIRQTEKGDSVCFKHWLRDKKTGKTTHCDEYETKIGNGIVLLELFKSLGYTDITLVDKTRTTYQTSQFEIAIDEVKGLGKFMEIEVKHEYKSVKEGLKSLENFLKELGLKKVKKMDRGYVSMIWNPKYDFGEDYDLTLKN